MIFHQIQLFACAAISRRYARQDAAAPTQSAQASALVAS
jgi:predicted Na+-dependent transporter